MRYAKAKKKPLQSKGKVFFVTTATVIAIYAMASNYLSGPDIEACASDKLAYCGCPKEQSEIAKRHLVLIDVTDRPPEGKKEDIAQLIKVFGAEHKSLGEWIAGGRRSDLMSIFIIGAATPSDTLATASFCKAPPKVSLFIQGQKREKQHLVDVDKIAAKVIQEIYAQQGNTQSRIVESISTLTSSSAAWADGSALILASDLRENSAQCGFFESGQVTKPELSSAGCREYFKTMRANMFSSHASRSTPTRAFICRFDSKEPKPGLSAYWDEVFLQATGFKPISTCSFTEMERIQKLSAGR